MKPTTLSVRNIVALLGALAMLVVSSCSEHRFICRRQRGAPSQLTAVWLCVAESLVGVSR